MKKFIYILITCILVYSFALINQTSDTNLKKYTADKLFDALDRDPNCTYTNTNPIHVNRPIIPESSRQMNDWIIGPEIPITGLTGFYDYQMNGSQAHHLWRFNATVMYADYMTSSDSLNVAASRRTKIAFSSDDGNTWTDFGPYPNFKSGFPCIHGKSNGVGMVGNHYSVNTPFPACGYINYDIIAGGGSFNGVAVPPNFAWPEVSRLTNGNMLEVGGTYQSAATDSIAAAVFNTTTLTFVAYNRLVSPAGLSGQSNQSIGSNCGVSSNAIILDNPYRETGGNYGHSRIWSVLTTDNGSTWGSFNLLFNPHIIGTDTICPNVNGSCDVIMDAAGNYYWAFNSLGPSGLYANGRLLVGKNTEEPQIIAGTHTSSIHPIPQIPDAMVQQAFISNFDHMCLSISDDQQYIFISYSCPFTADTLNGFNKCHIFYQFANLSTMVWSVPIQVTLSGPNSYDERYASINRVTPSAGGYTVYFVYQKDPQPGSSSYSDNAPITRASLIFRKVTSAITVGVEKNEGVVHEYNLSQNYPNPFNQETKIKFSLPHPSKGGAQAVKLVVYDILGREVTTLVNEKLRPGTYEVEWDAGNYPSGVYFYSIQADYYKETKKMILVK